MHAVKIDCVSASLRWGYALAGTLNAVTIEKVPGAWSLTASIQSLDHFKASQRPLTVEVTHEKGSWRWPVQSLQVNEQSLTATLGPREA